MKFLLTSLPIRKYKDGKEIYFYKAADCAFMVGVAKKLFGSTINFKDDSKYPIQSDGFFLRGDQRISLRSHIFRKLIANFIIRREYMDASPSTFIIYKDCVEVTNANNPHGNGLLLPVNFSLFPKNPLIAKFFIQLGRVDELGSGVVNVYRYLKDYSPEREPQFIEDKLFRTVIPVGGIITDHTNVEAGTNNDAITKQVKDRLIKELITYMNKAK